MLNSRDISLLRPDVEANCRTWIRLCKERGLNVLVTSTVRDEEYQAYLYEQGRTRAGAIVTNSKTPSFHWDKAGLAFDFCKNIKGHEYDDDAFFEEAGAIAKQMGFTWGGDWKSFPDRPHVQWDAYGWYSASMIRSGKMPHTMPNYEEESMQAKEVLKILEESEAERAAKAASPWAEDAWNKATEKGLFDGTAPQRPLTRQEAALVLERLGLL